MQSAELQAMIPATVMLNGRQIWLNQGRSLKEHGAHDFDTLIIGGATGLLGGSKEPLLDQPK